MCLTELNGRYETKDQVTWEEESIGELQQVFLNGKVTREFTLEEIRANAEVK